MPRDPLELHAFALVVVRLGRRILLVREREHGGGWYMPAGRVEPGESLTDAAVRETLEEAGVPVTLDGVVRVEYTPVGNTTRLRVIFTAHPSDDTPPKSVPDEHTEEARYVTLDELAGLPLRGGEVESIARYVLGGGAVYPLSTLGNERERWREPPRG
jgi:phosphatase NudJ